MSRQGTCDPRLLAFVGGEIAAKRRERGMTQEDLAWVSGLHRTSLGRIEGGTCDPSIVTLSYLYFQLDCTRVIIDRRGIIPELAEVEPPTPKEDLTGLKPPTMVYLLGKLVQTRRKEMGLSLKELARISGLHPNSLWNFETGLVCPTVSTYFHILRSLGVTRVGHHASVPLLD